MDKDSFLEKIKQIGTLEDEVERIRNANFEIANVNYTGVFKEAEQIAKMNYGSLYIRMGELGDFLDLVSSGDKSKKELYQKLKDIYEGTFLNPESLMCVDILDKKITFDVKGFFQSNVAMLEKTIEIIKKDFGGQYLLDMYAGVGTFSTFLSDNFTKTILVEHNRDAISLAEINLHGTNHESYGVSGEKWVNEYSDKIKTEFDGVVGSGQRLMDKCEFCKYCKENAKTLSEPEWYAFVTNVSLSCDGADFVHEISRPYPKYSRAETDDKIRHAVEENKPHTCEYIKNRLNFSGCKDCNVKAPIALAVLSMAEQATELADAELDENTINAQIKTLDTRTEELVNVMTFERTTATYDLDFRVYTPSTASYPINVDISKVRIVCLGDSLTSGHPFYWE